MTIVIVIVVVIVIVIVIFDVITTQSAELYKVVCRVLCAWVYK